MRKALWLLISVLLSLAANVAPAGLSPQTGRFLQADPNSTGLTVQNDTRWFHGAAPSVQPWAPELSTRAGNGVQLYQYVGSNPIARSDPMGLSYDMFDEVGEIAAEHTFSGLYGVTVARGHAQSELRKIQAYTRAAFLWDEMVMDRDEAILFSLIGSPFFSTICFEAGTPVAGPDGLPIAIERIGLGDAVFSTRDPWGLPPSGLAADPDSVETIDPASWQRISFETINASGCPVTGELLRPLAWVEAAGAKVGESLSIDFHGLNLAAPVCVRSIQPCPSVAPPAPGSEEVTGAFRTEGVAIVRVKLFGDDKPIGVTTGHPFFVHDTGEWVPAGELKPGQRVRTLDGYASVVSVEDRSETTTVYNLEVRRSHTYYAGASRAWVHNPCNGVRAPGGGVSASDAVPGAKFPAFRAGNKVFFARFHVLARAAARAGSAAGDVLVEGWAIIVEQGGKIVEFSTTFPK
ncbi:MAG: polymorphic toxin-type HINT domain-containing protein [Phycisphaerales bacterium]|nr:hypothetical protein [Planctomycetota bacterium]